MLNNQVLTSGILIRQNIETAIRLPVFDSHIDDFPFWTHGGSVVLLSYLGKIYGITCRHIRGDGEHAAKWSDLFIPVRKASKTAIAIGGCFSASQAWGHAVDSDIHDVAILTFGEDVNADTFGGAPYILDPNTICRSSTNDDLLVHGTLKERTLLTLEEAATTYCHLGCTDSGVRLSDATLRSAEARLDVQFNSVAGISGGAVYNITQRALCGMVVRGGLTGAVLSVHYLDIHHVVKMIQSVQSGNPTVHYRAKAEAFLVR